MKFQTETGSVYEVNNETKQIRRLNGVKDPTPRQGKDGEWRSFSKLYPDPIQQGEQVMIVWGVPLPPTEDTKDLYRSMGQEPPETIMGGTTITSRIVEVHPDQTSGA